jgi:phosphoribosyl 1,2-cyclic phosphodiesterase
MDAIGGLDDLREVQIRGSTTTVYSDRETEGFLRRMFPYLFPVKRTQLYVASIQHKAIEPYETFQISDLLITPIPLWHGDVTCLGYVFRQEDTDVQFVYFSDFKCKSTQEPKDYPAPDKYGRVIPQVLPRDFENFTLFLDPERALTILKSFPISVMILDCLDWGIQTGHISHSDYLETVQLIKCFRRHSIEPEQVYLTGIGCSLDHLVLVQHLTREFGDSKVMPAYDSMRFKI